MTTSPAPRALLPVLGRMSLGLLLALLGVLVTWRGVSFKPTPGLETTHTPLNLPLDGPLPLDLAKAATLRFEGDRTSIDLKPLAASSPNLLSGEAQHRTRNPVSISSRRQGGNVTFTTKLYVKALNDRGVVVTGPEPFQHHLNAALSPNVPLTVNTYTVGGNQTLNLRGLRVRALTSRSDSGDLTLTLPARPGGPYALVTRSGNVKVSAPSGATPEAVRVNSQSGDLNLDLQGASLDALNAGTQSGDVQLTLPQRVRRGSVTTISGDVVVKAQRGMHGNLDIRTQSGDVTLRVPAGLRTRIRFTDRDTVILPRGTPPATAPQLDVFVDTSTGTFSLDAPSSNPPEDQP